MFQNISIYEQLTALPYLPAYKRLIEGAIELDVFSQLEEPITAANLAGRMGWHEGNTLNLLQGLHSTGYVKRTGDAFQNTLDTSKYLVKDKPEYMGGVLLFFGSNQGMALEGLVEQVINGPKPMEQTGQSLDFAAYGAMMRQAQSGIRQQELLELVRSLPENGSIKHILDLGCGAGLLGIAVVNDEPGRSGVLFDQPPMKPLIEKTVSLYAMQDKLSVMSGDFTKDDIGSGYDLILCSSIMLFAIMGGPDFFGKLRGALNSGGVVLCLNEGIEPDRSGPWDMVLGYLTYNMQGMPMGIIKGQVAEMAKAGGFENIENRTLLLSTGTHDINILR